jgi:hypothetical protein
MGLNYLLSRTTDGGNIFVTVVGEFGGQVFV